MKRRTRALAIGCALSLLVAACGDDDDVASGGDGDEQAAGEDLDAYCDMIEELDSQDGPPTEEQMTEIKELRPDAIGEEIDMVADAFIEAEGDIGAVFADPEIEEAFEVIDAHDAEECGFESPEDGEGGEVDPEFAAYCEASAAMEEADGPPTTETIEELVGLMSEDIVDQGQIVLEAFEANDGDVGAVFSDPAVGEAIGAIEAWEAEHCGGGGEDEDDGDLEAADGAEVVPVTGVDFEFEGVPETVSAGPVAFEFTNDGDAIHEAVLFALDGKSVDDVIADATAAFEADEDDLGELGFAFSPPGGDARYINTDLEAGEYVFICFIPGPEGKAHHELGMQQTFTVG